MGNLQFLVEFLTGSGPTERKHTDKSQKTQWMEASFGAQNMRRDYVDKGCRDGTYEYSTGRAAWDTLVNPHSRNLLGPAAQVGGWMGEYSNSSDGESVTFTITNTAGTYSFFYHAVDDRPSGSTGPMRTIRESFTWTEPTPSMFVCH